MKKGTPLKLLVAGTLATLLLTVGAQYIVFGGEELTVEPLEEIEAGKIPGPVLLWLDRGKESEGFGAFLDGEDLYLAVRMGQCPTGGYGVLLGDARLENDEAVVTAEFSKPKPWEFVIQVLTYPNTVVKLATGGENPAFARFLGVDGALLAHVAVVDLAEE